MRLLLEEWMAKRHVSQAQVAAGLGITRAAVSAWIVGRMRGGKRYIAFPDQEMLEALCNFLECTPCDLLQMEKTETPTGKTWRDFSALSVA